LSHLDDETIALAAIGETLAAADDAHLAACDLCRDEVAALSVVVSIARTPVGADTLVAPPPAVWARIAAETGVDPAALPTSLTARREDRDRAAERGVDDRDGPGSTDASATRSGGDGRERSRRTGFLVAASVAGLVLGVGGTLAWQSVDNPDVLVVASASLLPLPDHSGTGEAEVVDTTDGRELELTLDTTAPTDAFLQVWLLSPDASLMVPVGVLDGSTGRWPLPPDVALADFPVVDVSIEPYDGEPTHSGNSVVRGTLEAGAAIAAAADLDRR
jgi:anti-sigma-K factor RskA